MTLTPRTQHTYVFGETLGNDTAMGGKMSALQGMRRSSSAVGPNERSRSGWGNGQDGSIKGGHETHRWFHSWAPHLSHQEPQEPPALEGDPYSEAPSKVRTSTDRLCFIVGIARTCTSSINPAGVRCLWFRTSAVDFWTVYYTNLS
jgi:hypothetical protein